MNEKIKTFFACVGGIFAAITVFFLGIFTGKRNNNSNSGGMGTIDAEHKQAREELAKAGRTQSAAEELNAENRELIGDCKSIIAAVEKRKSQKTN